MRKVGNAVIADESVYIHNPNAAEILIQGGRNTLFVPMPVLLTLGQLSRKPDIGPDADEAITLLEDLRNGGSPNLVVTKGGSNLDWVDKKDHHHLFIAYSKKIIDERADDFNKVKIVSRDAPTRMIAYELRDRENVFIENYTHDDSKELKHQIKEINVPLRLIQEGGFFPYSEQLHPEKILLNEGVICRYGKSEIYQAAVRKCDSMKIISDDIGAYSFFPRSINGNGPNWSQFIALEQLLDIDIELVFLKGGAGTGKTLGALAAGIHQLLQGKYKQIVISRPMVHLEDEDNLGFLPGKLQEKMNPWLAPIWSSFVKLENMAKIKNALPPREKETADLSKLNKSEKKKHNRYLKERKESQKLLEKILSETSSNLGPFIGKMMAMGQIQIVPLDTIRGVTFEESFLIIDEGQNLTPHQTKTIISRAGFGTKVVFTGDLGQIDRKKRLDRKSSGLTYAMDRMKNNEIVGVTTFRDSDTVRSKLVRLTLEKL